jgi:hypothetical protein
MVNHHTGNAPSTVPSNLNQPCTKPSTTAAAINPNDLSTAKAALDPE